MRPVRQVTGIGPPLGIALLAFAIICILPNANADFAFTPGHLYATYQGDTTDINEYSETGAFLGSLNIPSLIPGEDQLHGIVFGPDGFLYAVKVNGAAIVPGFSVLVLDSSGTVHNTYTYTNTFFDYLSYGKIALDQQYIYVAGGTDLFRFTLGDPTSGVSIYYNLGFAIFDVKTLPNGHLFVAYAYGVDEITNTGTIVRSIPLIGALWVDVRGIEYDPTINKLFATELGYSFFDFQLMRIDASTGVLENHVSFVYGDDLFLTRSNTLLVGSQSQAPAIYDENLAFIGPLGTAQRAFVTQYPTPGPTPTPTPAHCIPYYTIAQIGGTIVPGTTDTGNHCDDCTTAVTLPFPFTLYDAAYTSVNVSSNGNAQFIGTSPISYNFCLPVSPWNYTIFPYWDDQMTNSYVTCSPGPCGIFTSVSGTAPHRIFNIEWRTQYYPGTGNANYELRLYEGQTRFDVIYGNVTNGNTSATAGVQGDHMAFTQYFCNGSGGAATGGQSYTLIPCPSPTPTPTASPTPTATPTPTPTPTPCTGRCAPTPRPHPTSTARPTPPSRFTPPPNASPSVTPAPRPTPPPRLTPPPTPTGSPRPTPAPRP